MPTGLSTFIMISVFMLSTGPASLAMTLDQLKRVEKIAETHEASPDEVKKTFEWLESLAKENPKDAEIFAQLSRVYFFHAIDHDDKKERIKRYQKSIDAADRALAVDPKNITANFWKAASIGKQGLDIGISKAFGNAPTMRKHLEIVLGVDEKFEHGGAHRAMGRLYYELPGWPFSFGDYKKALAHMKKALALDPNHLGNRVYYAQAELKETGDKAAARPHIEAVLNAKSDPNHNRELNEYKDVAKKLKDDL